MKILKFLLALLALIPLQAAAYSETLQVWLDESLTFVADGKTVTYLTISEYDPETDYMVFNMAIHMPPGLRLNQVKSGREYVNDVFLTERGTDKHILMSNMPDSRTLKIACFSENIRLYPDDEEGNIYHPLVRIGLIADPTAYNGTYAVEMEDVVFGDANDGVVTGAYIDHIEYSTFEITGGTDYTGVDYVMSASKYDTMILPFDCEIPQGLRVFSCVGIENGEVLLSEESAIVANTPYIVQGEAKSYHLTGEPKDVYPWYTTEFMTGSYERVLIPTYTFVLNTEESEDAPVFRKVKYKEEYYIEPYHCFINRDELNNYGNSLNVSDKVITGIEDVMVEDEGPVDVYNVLGQLIRVNVESAKSLNGLQPGIYIVNGKKYVVK